MNRRDFMKVAGAAPLLGAPAVRRTGQSPMLKDFDYIIVGAGSSGCVLANRLSADPSARVLLLEAGGPTENDPEIVSPGRWASLIGSVFDWGYSTEPEPGLHNRPIPFPRGRVHGGSSAVNAMTFIRGHAFCYEGWDRSGNPNWGYQAVLPFFKRLERNQTGATPHRGGDGPLAVSHCTDPHAGHWAFLAAAGERGFASDAVFDFNAPGPVNTAGYYQKNILNGKRHSAADAYLQPALLRPNLEVRSRSVATRLVIERARAVGIEYLQSGQIMKARATREVIICGGVVDSPKLLLLSGIGPSQQLKFHGIAVVVDLPGVGQNFHDHLKLPVRWNSKTELPGSTVTAGMFTRSNPAAGGNPPDIQFYVGRGLDSPERFITITVSLVQSKSRGAVQLRSASPAAPPIIRGNYLREQADVDALVQGVKLARSLGSARAYASLRTDEVLPGPSIRSSADVAAFVRATADTIYHAGGTCKMGPRTDGNAVVDASLRVRGIEGLRVADASIMPELVNAPTHAACVMIGEKAAVLIAG